MPIHPATISSADVQYIHMYITPACTLYMYMHVQVTAHRICVCVRKRPLNKKGEQVPLSPHVAVISRPTWPSSLAPRGRHLLPHVAVISRPTWQSLRAYSVIVGTLLYVVLTFPSASCVYCFTCTLTAVELTRKEVNVITLPDTAGILVRSTA